MPVCRRSGVPDEFVHRRHDRPIVHSWRGGIGRRLVRFKCACWVLRCKHSARQDLHERHVHTCIHTDRLDTYLHAPIHMILRKGICFYVSLWLLIHTHPRKFAHVPFAIMLRMPWRSAFVKVIFSVWRPKLPEGFRCLRPGAPSNIKFAFAVDLNYTNFLVRQPNWI